MNEKLKIGTTKITFQEFKEDFFQAIEEVGIDEGQITDKEAEDIATTLFSNLKELYQL